MDRFTERYLRFVDGLPRIGEAVANLPAPLAGGVLGVEAPARAVACGGP